MENWFHIKFMSLVQYYENCEPIIFADNYHYLHCTHNWNTLMKITVLDTVMI